MLDVNEQVLHRTLSDLRALLPNEGVGLWSGTGQRVQTWTPLPNIASRPQVRYEVDPKAWIEAWFQIGQNGETPLALVHSHPTAEPLPSEYDRAHWQYPDLLCVIVSFAGDKPRWQAFQLPKKQDNL